MLSAGRVVNGVQLVFERKISLGDPAPLTGLSAQRYRPVLQDGLIAATRLITPVHGRSRWLTLGVLCLALKRNSEKDRETGLWFMLLLSHPP